MMKLKLLTAAMMLGVATASCVADSGGSAGSSGTGSGGSASTGGTLPSGQCNGLGGAALEQCLRDQALRSPSTRGTTRQ